jgi:hypothetical protein
MKLRPRWLPFLAGSPADARHGQAALFLSAYDTPEGRTGEAVSSAQTCSLRPATTWAGRYAAKLGYPNGAAHLRPDGNTKAIEVVRLEANKWAERLRRIVLELRAAGGRHPALGRQRRRQL